MQQQMYSQSTQISSNGYNNSTNTQSNKALQLKYKINYLKLKRITELNQNLKKELLRDRITSSNASLQIINYTNDLFSGKDYTVPSVSGQVPRNSNPLLKTSNKGYSQSPNGSNSNDPGCCTIM